MAIRCSTQLDFLQQHTHFYDKLRRVDGYRLDRSYLIFGVSNHSKLSLYTILELHLEPSEFIHEGNLIAYLSNFHCLKSRKLKNLNTRWKHLKFSARCILLRAECNLSVNRWIPLDQEFAQEFGVAMPVEKRILGKKIE